MTHVGYSCLTGHVPPVLPPCTPARGDWRGCPDTAACSSAASPATCRVSSVLVAGAAAATDLTTHFAAAQPRLSPARASHGRISRRQPRLRRPGAGGRAARQPRGPAAPPAWPGRRRRPARAQAAAAPRRAGRAARMRPPAAAAGSSAAAAAWRISCPTSCACAPQRPPSSLGRKRPLPAHGGVLQRCSSVVFSCPTSCACAPQRPPSSLGRKRPLPAHGGVLQRCSSVAFSCPTSCACAPQHPRLHQGVGPLASLKNVELCSTAAHCSDGSCANSGHKNMRNKPGLQCERGGCERRSGPSCMQARRVAAVEPGVRRHSRPAARAAGQAGPARPKHKPTFLAAGAVQRDASHAQPRMDWGTGTGRGRPARARARACSPPSDAESSRLCARRLATSSCSRCSASAFCCAALRRAASLPRVRAFRVWVPCQGFW